VLWWAPAEPAAFLQLRKKISTNVLLTGRVQALRKSRQAHVNSSSGCTSPFLGSRSPQGNTNRTNLHPAVLPCSVPEASTTGRWWTGDAFGNCPSLLAAPWVHRVAARREQCGAPGVFCSNSCKSSSLRAFKKHVDVALGWWEWINRWTRWLQWSFPTLMTFLYVRKATALPAQLGNDQLVTPPTQGTRTAGKGVDSQTIHLFQLTTHLP